MKPSVSALLFFSLLFYAVSTAAQNTVVFTKYGYVWGTGTDIRVFKGIPYALAPVGNLRWKPPQPLRAWKDTLQTKEYGCICLQGDRKSDIASENCLTLNVWAPAKNAGAGLPVMVWIHGGGFQHGSSRIYGEMLASKGVVVVSINYRLGIFGFLAHPQLSQESPHRSSGNYGLLDQIAALRWVQENIKAFGGNPGKVTVFGQSAGATSIGCLLVSPLAKDLFQRAILQSASRLCMPDVHLSEDRQGLTAMESVGEMITNDINELRKKPAEEVVEQGNEVTNFIFGEGGKARLGLRPESRIHRPGSYDSPWWSFADGWVVPNDISLLLAAGKIAPVPLLLGTTADEGSRFVLNLPLHTEAAYRAYLKKVYPTVHDTLFSLYPAREPEAIRSAVSQLINDAMFLYGTREVAKAALRKGSDVYLYRFSAITPHSPNTASGAFHGAELPYLFGRVNNNDVFNDRNRMLSEVMMKAWVNFAATGNPNGEGVPNWPAYKTPQEPYLQLGDSIQVKTAMPKEKLKWIGRAFSTEKPWE